MKAKIYQKLLSFPVYTFLDSSYFRLLKTHFLGSKLDHTNSNQLHKFANPTIFFLMVSWGPKHTNLGGFHEIISETYRYSVKDSLCAKVVSKT